MCDTISIRRPLRPIPHKTLVEHLANRLFTVERWIPECERTRVRTEIEAHGDVRAAIEHTLRVTGQALFSTTLILCCGFGLYVTGYMQNFANFGIVTSFALAMALLADIAVAPALVTLMDERSNTPSRTA